jgi:hypothetical protein
MRIKFRLKDLNESDLQKSNIYIAALNRLCGLVVRVLGYRAGGAGSIPGATRFSEKQWV